MYSSLGDVTAIDTKRDIVWSLSTPGTHCVSVSAGGKSENGMYKDGKSR